MICLKVRAACDLIIYFELAHNLVLGLCPQDYGAMKYWTVGITMIVVFFMGTTLKMRYALLATAVTTLVLFLGIYPFVYNESLTVFAVVFRVALTALTHSFMVTMCMLIVYIVRIRTQLVGLFSENLSLFNKMHEGLVVMDKLKESICFANYPAIGFLKDLTKNLFP